MNFCVTEINIYKMVFDFFTFLDISSDSKGKIFPLKQKLYIF